MKNIPIYETIPFFRPDTENAVPELIPYLAEGKNRSCVILCPGGAYWGLADHEGRPVAEWMNQRGITAFVLRYRCMPHRYPCQLYDVQRAIRYVRAHASDFSVDPQKIIIMGFSAGGHCAAMGGTFTVPADADSSDPVERVDSSVAGMILCYPVISLTDHCHEETAQNISGSDWQIREQLSIEKAVHKGMPPLFLWHTFDDGAVPVYNSFAMAMAYERLGLECELHIYPHGNHGLGLAQDHENVRNWTLELERWLSQYGFLLG